MGLASGDPAYPLESINILEQQDRIKGMYLYEKYKRSELSYLNYEGIQYYEVSVYTKCREKQ